LGEGVGFLIKLLGWLKIEPVSVKSD